MNPCSIVQRLSAIDRSEFAVSYPASTSSIAASPTACVATRHPSRFSSFTTALNDAAGTGIIDTIHLVEVARALERLDGAPGWSRDEAAETRRWFADYLDWLTTDQYGKDERDATNNHATCWVMQVAAFAHYTGNAWTASFMPPIRTHSSP